MSQAAETTARTTARTTVGSGERDELLDRAADAAERTGHRYERLRDFLGRYYRHVPVEDLAEREPLDLAGAALSHKQLAGHRPQGTANVRVFTPTVDEYGWTSGHTVVEIVTDDMPFLVDSVTAELPRHERGIHLWSTRRSSSAATSPARLAEVLEVAPRTGPARRCPRRRLVESWIHIEIDREPRPRAAGTTAQRVCAGCSTTSGWPSRTGRRCASGPGDRRRAARPRRRPGCRCRTRLTERARAAGVARRRPLHLPRLPRVPPGRRRRPRRPARRRTGTGLGILRDDQHRSRELRPADRRRRRPRRARSSCWSSPRPTPGPPCTASAYLDYIGVKSSTTPAR